jgi:putative transposase
VLNRANGRLRLFRKDEDFLAFEKVLIEAMRRRPVRLLDWCLMSNHWHFVVWPRKDDDLTEFFRWLTHTHTQRWHAHHGTSGMGHVYQGRFKCFPVEADDHLEGLLRYVQLNPVRAKAVRRAPAWRWGSCHVRRRGPQELAGLLSDWPIDMPRDWDAWLDEGVGASASKRITTAMERSQPLGDQAWTLRIAGRLNLLHTLNPRGRPKGKNGNDPRPL